MAGSKHAPYIMPDGSGKRLSEYLKDNSLSEKPPRRSQSSGLERKWKVAEVQGSNGADPDVQALVLVGRSKRRRWLADTLLRKMAGALTVDAMEALFQPVPFGEVRESVLEKISTPDNAPIWDMFRSIDPDKQQKVLLKWEEHIRGEKQSNAQSSSAAQIAWQRWAAVPRKARTVLKQADPEGVAILELSYLQFMEDAGDLELVLTPPDAFQRLIAHGLASFHGLLSASTANAELETKSVMIRRPRGASALPAPEVTCADILFALAEQPAGLTPALLAEYTAHHSHERSSEASYVFARTSCVSCKGMLF